MTQFLALATLLLANVVAVAQTKAALTTPPAVVSVVEGVTGKRFVPDTAYAALTDEDKTVLVNASTANWSLAQEAGAMLYHNLVVGTRSYQVVIIKSPNEEFPKATLIRYTDPKAKPEPIARGTLRPRPTEKPK